ncbi:hypothetical protein [Pyruvatibacter mobilis]
MNKDIKMVALVAAGVMLAGLVMSFGRSYPLIGDAHNGFDS